MSNTRVFRASKTGKASIELSENSAALIGDKRHFVICDDKGVTIKGPVSFVSDSLGRRTGGLFVGINDFFEMIPQTIITPVPSKIPFPPLALIPSIGKDIAFFLSLLV